jgi:hypothetical protein
VDVVVHEFQHSEPCLWFGGLVLRLLFDATMVNFPRVGHTREDFDQRVGLIVALILRCHRFQVPTELFVGLLNQRDPAKVQLKVREGVQRLSPQFVIGVMGCSLLCVGEPGRRSREMSASQRRATLASLELRQPPSASLVQHPEGFRPETPRHDTYLF